jgi:hypothetical protein
MNQPLPQVFTAISVQGIITENITEIKRHTNLGLEIN